MSALRDPNSVAVTVAVTVHTVRYKVVPHAPTVYRYRKMIYMMNVVRLLASRGLARVVTETPDALEEPVLYVFLRPKRPMRSSCNRHVQQQVKCEIHM